MDLFYRVPSFSAMEPHRFSLLQGNCPQKPKLQEPVVCGVGILLVELLGRLQRQEMDVGSQFSPPPLPCCSYRFLL